MDDPALPHSLISLKKVNVGTSASLPSADSPARGFRPPQPLSCPFPQLTAFGHLGPCTPFQAFLMQHLPLGSAAASRGPLRSLRSPPPFGTPPARVLRHEMTSEAREGGGAQPPLPKPAAPAAACLAQPPALPPPLSLKRAPHA